MTQTAEYTVLLDERLVLHPMDSKDFDFNVQENHFNGILSWVMVESDPPGAARYSMTLNATSPAIMNAKTPPDPDRRAIYEVIDHTELHNGANTLTVKNESTSGTVQMSDIVVWFHRNIP